MPDALPERQFLVDNSVWQRASQEPVAVLLEPALAAGRLLSSGPLVAEVLYSGRSAAEVGELREELTRGLDCLFPDEDSWTLAFDAMEQMASHSPQFHRRPLPDYLTAALAHQHGVAVLHYDRDYERLANLSGLRFDHLWVVEPGSLDSAPKLTDL